MLYQACTRPPVSDRQLDEAIAEVALHLRTVIAQKGSGAFVSPHEVWGVLDEEVTEFKQAVMANDAQGMAWELRDIAIVAIFALAGAKIAREAPPPIDRATRNPHDYYPATSDDTCAAPSEALATDPFAGMAQ
jgi:hypothetical protein